MDLEYYNHPDINERIRYREYLSARSALDSEEHDRLATRRYVPKMFLFALIFSGVAWVLGRLWLPLALIPGFPALVLFMNVALMAALSLTRPWRVFKLQRTVRRTWKPEYES